MNDVFRMLHDPKIETRSLQIYNRWGSMLFWPAGVRYARFLFVRIFNIDHQRASAPGYRAFTESDRAVTRHAAARRVGRAA
ncbi:MAG: hypothetical protein IPJ82_19790 [Lewinellaceae bacterium]|nr:hypothetical protein [Lewinellaceae bacterium]